MRYRASFQELALARKHQRNAYLTTMVVLCHSDLNSYVRKMKILFEILIRSTINVLPEAPCYVKNNNIKKLNSITLQKV